MKGIKKSFFGFIISHTHWDRAWYLPFEKYRLKLLKLTEKLLNILKYNPKFKFTFDGQTVLLEDILQIHPEWARKLKRYITNGKIMVGPWYSLPDEFLVSGEALIRNLLIGQRMAEKFGRVMKVGYTPDPFGHIAQLPQILNGFRIESFVFTRGMDDTGEDLGSEFIWIAPDNKSKVIAHHQITNYCNAANLGYIYENGNLSLSYDKAVEQIENLLARLKKYARAPAFYISNGCDHLEPQPELPEIIKYLNIKCADGHFIQSTPEDFFNYVKKFRKKFKIYKNELRGSRYAPLLPGVFSSRIYLKQQNFYCQNLLERWVEPFCAISHFVTDQTYPAAEINYAWRTLLKNHPHDDICGCSIDEVHKEDLVRYMLVYQVGDGLLTNALKQIVAHIDKQISNSNDTNKSIALFNPLPWDRQDPVEIYIPQNWINGEFLIKDSANNLLPHQILKRENDNLVLMVKPCLVPSLGYETIYISKNETRAKDLHADIIVSKNTIENSFLKVTAEKNGTVTIFDKSSGKIYKNFNLLEDTEDVGDEYDYSPADNSLTITNENIIAGIKVIESGPIRASLLIKYKLHLPKSLTVDRKRRHSQKVSNPVEIKISLFSGVPRVDFELKFLNKAKDHRLRVLFPTDIETDVVKVEEHFHIIERKINTPKCKNWRQIPQPTNHMENFVAIDDRKFGVAIIGEGLPEYEIRNDTQGATICLTLLRCVEWLSRDDLKTRSEHAGPRIAVPEAQSLGQHTFHYAVVFYKKDLLKEGVIKLTYEHNIPMKFIIIDKNAVKISDKNRLPARKSFLKIIPDNLFITAIKKCEDRDSLIIRGYSIPSQNKKSDLKGKIYLWDAPKKVYLTNLSENRHKEIKSIKQNKISISAKNWQIITIEVEI